MDPGESHDDLLASLAATADPDLALTGLARLVEAVPDRPALVSLLATDEGFRDRLTAVLRGSAALAEHLARHPDHWPALAADTGPTRRPTPVELQHGVASALSGRT